MSRSFLFAVAALSLAASATPSLATARSIGADIEVRTTNAVSNYEPTQTAGVYRETKSKAHQLIQITGSGELAGLGADNSQELDSVITIGNDVTGTSVAEVRVINVKKKLFAITYRADLVSREGNKINKDYAVDAVLTQGSVEDYLAGREVTLAYTDQGLKAEKKATMQILATGLAPALSEINEDLKTKGKVKLKSKLTEFSRSTCILSAAKMKCNNPLSVLKVSLGVRLN